MSKRERKANSKHKKLMVSRSKSRKTIGPCSSSVQASSFRRFPMIPLEQREGRSVWVMGRNGGHVSGVGVCVLVWMCMEAGDDGSGRFYRVWGGFRCQEILG